MAQEYKITESMKERYLKELEYLETVKMHEIAAEIDVARGFGDLSENAEYHEAKEAQGHLMGEIANIRHILDNAIIISDEATEDMKGIVGLGCTVKVRDLEFEEDELFCIVGTQEANPMECRISDESPLGKALMGKKVGDIAEYEAPCGIVRYEILGVER
ncbi:MAG: transcription elongation factor GreA [Oscillospiraceae bacterium]|nr:transcription elongation factor GreA [Oscillospiraceae bacterium]